MSRIGSMGNKLYRGEVSYDFVGKQKRWYAISGVILLLALGGLLFRGLQLGIEFRGGSEFSVTAPAVTVAKGQDAVAKAGVTGEPKVQKIGGDTLRIQTEQLSTQQSQKVQQSIADEFSVPANQVSSTFIGPSWGADVSSKALKGLIVFLVLVVIYLSITFEWKMAVSAIVALLHDIVITIGIYALVGFEVTPATVIGLLTILGYSLYDTVVVFDKVRENTAGLQGGSRMTYSEAANLAINQTLVRSINTSVIALLPIGAILFVGAGLLGAGTLKDLSLSLFIGVAAGTYSSIFIATPLLADLKEREPAMQALASRVAARKTSAAGGGKKAPARAAAVGASGGATATAVLDDPALEDGAQDEGGPEQSARPARPAGPRNQPRRTQNRRPSGRKKR
ncbi:MAG: protein translocase subunit SecF [Motilibacteraceae bacterium]